MNGPAAFRLLLGTLLAAPLAAFAAPASVPPIPCATGNTSMLAGSSVSTGATFSIAIGMTAATPVKPVNGWTLARCDSEQVVFTRADVAGKDFLTALASHVALEAWTDEEAFEAQVKRTVERNPLPRQHLRTVSVKASTVDGRPCVDLLRVGTVEPMRAADGSATPPMFTRERLRTCHLRDARGPEAAVMMMFKEIALHDPLRFDDAALPFLDGVTLPPWSR